MRAALALIAIVTSATGQATQNHAHHWDQTTEFTSRGANGGAKGFVSTALPYGLHAGLETLTSVQYVIQDQDLSTWDEVWHVGICGIDGTGAPDYATTTYYAKNLRIPATPEFPWVITHNGLANAPLKIPPTLTQWHHVWELATAANWTTDGLSFHWSQGAPWNNTLLCAATALGPQHREIPRIEGAGQILEELAWSTQPSQRPVALDQAWRLRTSWSEIVLRGGADNATYNALPCPNPNFGLAAVDPDFFDSGSGTPARFDDYAWDVTAGPAYANGAGVLLLSMAVFPDGGVATQFGRLHLDIADPLFQLLGPLAMPPLSDSGSSRYALRLGATSPLRQVMKTIPSLSAQAAVFGQRTPLKLSSLWTMRPTLTPTGFTAASAIVGQPFAIARQPMPPLIELRNDGRGELKVQGYAQSTKIGPELTVGERSMVRVTTPAAATRVEIAGSRTTATRFIYR